MNPSNKIFLDQNRHHHDTLVKAFYLRNLDGNTRSKMQSIIAEEFQPGYTADLWCPSCVSDMILKLYRHYDEWLISEEKRQQAALDNQERQEDEEERMLLEISRQPSEDQQIEDQKSKEPPPLIVPATFPSHKKRKKKPRKKLLSPEIKPPAEILNDP